MLSYSDVFVKVLHCLWDIEGRFTKVGCQIIKVLDGIVGWVTSDVSLGLEKGNFTCMLVNQPVLAVAPTPLRSAGPCH